MDHHKILQALADTGQAVCQRVQESLRTQTIEQLSAASSRAAADTIYQIDKNVEDLIVARLQQAALEAGGIVLIAEGIGEDEKVVLPAGMPEEQAKIRLLADPVDGTRGIMYNKRSAFFLAGAAPNHGKNTRLSDIEVAVMVELPTTRCYLSDTLYAIKGQGAKGFTTNLFTGEQTPLSPRPSAATSLLGGFAQIARFFPPGRDVLARIEESMLQRLYPNADLSQTILFEDQYISSGGQVYEMLMGHDRFVADIRTLLFRKLVKEGGAKGHTCHPYDLAAHLIGTEAGLVICSPRGQPLDAPFDTTSDVDWLACANQRIFDHVYPALTASIKEAGLI